MSAQFTNDLNVQPVNQLGTSAVRSDQLPRISIYTVEYTDRRDSLPDIPSVNRLHREHNRVEEPKVGTKIIERIADREGVDPVDLDVPLYEVIDPHSLDALTDVTSNRQHGAHRRVEFLYYGYRVTVDGNRSISIDEQPPDAKTGASLGEGPKSSREVISAELERRETVLRRISEIIADADRSFDEQVDDLLESVRDAVGTEYATLSYVDDDTYVFEAIDMPSEVRLEAGETAPLAELPPCKHVVAAERALVVNDLESEAPELADSTWGISSYIGVPVFVDDEVYGTFCFYGVHSRSEAFSDWDLTVVELLGNWVGGELERRNQERVLDAYSSEQPVANRSRRNSR